MSGQALVLNVAGVHPWMAERTKRSLRHLGFEVLDDAKQLSADAPGLWLIAAGAWSSRTALNCPQSAQPLALIGATTELPAQPGAPTLPTKAWCDSLQLHGGELKDHLNALPEVQSLWLNSAAIRETGNDISMAALLKRATDAGWRIVRHAPFDVHFDDRMRVLEVVTSLQRGGAERVALDLHRTIENRAMTSRLCALGSPTRQPFPTPQHTVSLAKLPFDPISRAEGIDDIARRLGMDLIHGHLLEAKTIEWLDAKAWPQVVTVHNQQLGWQPGFSSLGKCDDLLLAACSLRVEKELAQVLPHQKARTVWNGIDTISLSPKERPRSEAPTLIAVANPRPQKRLPKLVDVLGELHSRGYNARLLMAGEPSSLSSEALAELEEVRNKARALNIADYVIEMGAIADVASLLEAADVFISASLYEGLSLAQLEALAVGLPVVTTDAGGAPEVGEQHSAMIVLPIDATATEFAEAVIQSLPLPCDSLKPSFTLPVMTARYRWLFHATLFAATRRTMPRKGLLLVTNNFSTGGAQSSARRLLTELHRTGEVVRAVVLQERDDHPTPGRKALIDEGIPVHVMQPPEVCEAATALVPLLEIIASNPPETVLFWNLIPEYKLLLVDALWDTTVFDVSPGEMLFSSLDRYFAKPRDGLPCLSWQAYGARLAGVVVKYSAEVSVASKLGAPVHVILNGVDIASAMPPALADSETIVIGTAARLHPHKRLEDLIEAFRLVIASGRKAILRIAGGEEQGLGEYAATLSEQSKDLPVEWLGDVADIPGFHAQLHIFAMISEPSGCPNASLEAMAAGLPIVATAVGGANDQIVDGECGFLTVPRDPQSMASRLNELIDSPPLREKLGRAAWQRAHEKFSVERMAANYRHVCLGR